jgi:hypothetical protein
MHLATLRARWGGTPGYGAIPFGGLPNDAMGFGRREIAREWPPPFIGDVAEQLAYRVSARPPVDVVTLLRSLGIEVQVYPFGTPQTGDFVGGQRPMIRVAPIDVGEQRFSIAHALGHMLLHTLPAMPQAIHVNHTGGANESEANNFAACLLIPRRMLDALMTSNFSSDINVLANAFQVPLLWMNAQVASFLGQPIAW